MNFNKKGAMELGISTVVMLVIAIVIIGAGIAFIRGFFGTGTDTLVGAFEVADFGLEPTSTRPIVLTDGKVNIKTGKQEIVRIGFYNKQPNSVTANVGFGRCVTSVQDACDGGTIKPLITSLEQEDIEIGAVAGFQTQITAKCENINGEQINLPAGDYTCNLIVYDCTENVNDCEAYDYDSTSLESAQIILSIMS